MVLVKLRLSRNIAWFPLPGGVRALWSAGLVLLLALTLPAACSFIEETRAPSPFEPPRRIYLNSFHSDLKRQTAWRELPEHFAQLLRMDSRFTLVRQPEGSRYHLSGTVESYRAPRLGFGFNQGAAVRLVAVLRTDDGRELLRNIYEEKSGWGPLRFFAGFSSTEPRDLTYEIYRQVMKDVLAAIEGELGGA